MLARVVLLAALLGIALSTLYALGDRGSAAAAFWGSGQPGAAAGKRGAHPESTSVGTSGPGALQEGETTLSSRGAGTSGSNFYDLSAEPQPEPLDEEPGAGRKPHEPAHTKTGALLGAGRDGPSSGARMALLAVAAARARDGAAPYGAST